MSNGKTTNKDIYERLAIVETQIDSLCDELIRIRTNDLNHIERAVEQNNLRIQALERKMAAGIAILGTLQLLVPYLMNILI